LRRSLLIGLSIRKAGKLEKKMDLLLATRNAHKTREFRQLLGPDLAVIDLSAFPDMTLPEETGSTFAKNAVVKAVTVSRHRIKDRPAFAGLRRGRHLLVAADDSGLEVDALGGAPGIYSARYAGEKATYAKNIEKLLSQLKAKNIVGDQRSARFRCVIALAQDGKVLGTFEGVVEGKIIDPPRGDRGFGYDPIFQPSGFQQTFGEMTAKLKNEISHRAKAAAALSDALRGGELQR
jgi:XTP/dITP diphosphohydrolase